MNTKIVLGSLVAVLLSFAVGCGSAADDSDSQAGELRSPSEEKAPARRLGTDTLDPARQGLGIDPLAAAASGESKLVDPAKIRVDLEPRRIGGSAVASDPAREALDIEPVAH